MDQLRRLFASLSLAQRVSIAVIGVLIGGGMLWFTHWQREAGFRPLFTSLSAEDASAIVAKLKESGVDFRISSNGASVMVPEAKVAELRLEMAGAGLPKTGRIGFEIFDKTNFGITDFAEHVNYRRAVEGELERSVMSISEVEQARVHVTFPKESVFLDAREPAKASVLVRLRPGASLQPQNVAAITHLVSSAVEGLVPAAVSVVDMQGNLLSRSKRVSADGAGSEEALEYQQKVERDLQAKINSTLEPLLGPDKYRTAVSVDADMSAGEQSEEVFDPSKSVMVTSQRTEDAPGSSITTGGQPGTASNLPRPPAAEMKTGLGPGRRTENVTYQSSRTTRHVKLQQGTIKRLSIAVLVDQTVQWEGKGAQMHRVLVPPPPEKLKTIHDLVATAVGLAPQRGDQLTVETLPFDSTLNAPPPASDLNSAQKPKPAPANVIELVKANPAAGWGAAGAVVLGIVLGAVLFRRKRAHIEVAPALPAAAADYERAAMLSGPVAQEPGAPQALRLPASRLEVMTGQLRESVSHDAELWAGVLRSWLSEEEKA